MFNNINIIFIQLINMEEQQKDHVNNPKHYTSGKYEAIDIMEDTFGIEATMNFCKLNAFKYIFREKLKNGIEDIKKANWYLTKYIELNEKINK